MANVGGPAVSEVRAEELSVGFEEVGEGERVDCGDSISLGEGEGVRIRAGIGRHATCVVPVHVHGG